MAETDGNLIVPTATDPVFASSETLIARMLGVAASNARRACGVCVPVFGRALPLSRHSEAFVGQEMAERNR